MTEDTPSEVYTSVGELHRILVDIRDGGQGKGTRLGVYLADEFGLPSDDMKAAISALMHFMELVERVREEAKALDLDPKYKEQIIEDIDYFYTRIWSLGTNADLNHAAKQLDASKVSGLRYVEMVMAASVAYPNVDGEAEELIELFNSLSSEVRNSNLPNLLKESVLDGLDDISISIRNYRIWGTDKAENQVFSLTGEVAVNAATDVAVKESNVTSKIMSVMGRSFQFLGKAQKASDDATKLISTGKSLAERLPDVF
jgi:hypothetical protein